ncbi:hypothetical protein K435DRAFT_280881 [Dendrothele bispora CBS 962.96]|uniref:Uncharacterized protein n=1 Tax=Dendrothele bispora (strain CBS 962.96) TaxID=1314807 RepID=A0A4S8LKU6_DENBC|nr:hypothetical protein K435DRAFT_280881 [Dendrothele bispora CBS 962.96]
MLYIHCQVSFPSFLYQTLMLIIDDTGIGWHGLSSSSSEMILEQPNSTPFREDDWFSFSGLMGSSTHSRPNHESNSNYSSNPSSLNSDSNPYSSSSDYSSNPSSVSSDFDPFSSVDPSPLIYNPSPGLIYGPSPLSYDPSPLSSDFNHFNAVDPSLLNHSFDPASIFDNEYHSLFSSDSDFPTSVDPSHHKSKQKRQLDHDSEVPQVEYSVKRLKSEQGFTTSHVPKRHNVEKNSEAQESKSEPVASGSSNAGIHYTDYTYTDREGKIRKEKPKENM